VAARRHPGSKADARFNFDHLKGVTQLAEHGLFDAVFLADGLASRNRPAADGRTSGSAGFEPKTLFLPCRR
jgi:alkanesulfonate monooxygenase